MSDLLISADTHLLEPPDLWSSRLPKSMRERAVRLEYTGDYMRFFKAGGREQLALTRYWGLDGAIDHETDADDRERDMVEDGVWAEVVHPNLGFFVYSDDNELAFAHARVYNDYLVELFGGRFDRHKPTAIVPLTDVDDAVAEVERVARLGIQAIMPPVAPPARYGTTTYDRVWAAAQANNMVVCFHIGGGLDLSDALAVIAAKRVTKRETGIDPDETVQMASPHANRLRLSIPPLEPQEIIADLVGGGVLERFPMLHFVITEYNAYWLAGLMGALDKAYTLSIGQDVVAPFVRFGMLDHRRPLDDQPLMPLRFLLNEHWPYPLRPSEYVRRQIHCTFQDDPAALALRHYTGITPLLWGSDYPHHEATWPRTRDAVDVLFADVPSDERALITRGTVAALFGFVPPPMG